MKRLICTKCNEFRSNGKFCLICGTTLTEKIELGIKINRFTTSKTPDTIRTHIRKILNRIGVQNSDIQIESNSTNAKVTYLLLGKKYQFNSTIQSGIANNLGAIENLLRGRILGIERGIEDTEQAFKGYEALPDYSNSSKKQYFDKTMNKQQLEYRYKELLKTLHPDAGGSAEEFIEMKTQYEELTK